VELIDVLAALIPHPRIHRHRYHGVLAPNSAHRSQVTALARAAAPPSPQQFPTHVSPADPAQRPERSPARLLWALLLARIYEIFPRRVIRLDVLSVSVGS
jgi:hypothetical protein